MIPAIVIAAIQQRLRSPVRMMLIAMTFGFPLLGSWFAPALGFQGISNGFYFAVMLSAGLIGQDVSAGVLQLLFARPVRRWEYVFSRWFAFSLMAVALVAVQVAIGASFLALRGVPIGIDAVAMHTASQILAAVGGVSVFTLLSSLIGGLAYYGARRFAVLDEPGALTRFLEQGGRIVVVTQRRLAEVRETASIEIHAQARQGRRALYVVSARKTGTVIE